MPIGVTYNYRTPDNTNRAVTQPSWDSYLSAYNSGVRQRQAGAVSPATGQMGQRAFTPQRENVGVRGAGTGLDGSSTYLPSYQNAGRSAQGQAQADNAYFNGQNFQSDPSHTYNEQLSQDMLQDTQDPRFQTTTVASGGVNLPLRAVQSLRSFKGAQQRQRQYQDFLRRSEVDNRNQAITSWAEKTDPNMYYNVVDRIRNGNAISDEELNNMYDQLKQKRTQDALTNDVTQFYADPQRQIKQGESVNAARQASLGQLAEQYNQLRVKQAQNAASHGLEGSSVAAEQSGSLGRQRDQAALGVDQAAAASTAQYSDEDRAMREQLMQLIGSNDPYAAQQIQSVLAGIGQRRDASHDLYANMAQGDQIGQLSRDAQSQAIGGGLNAGAQWAQNQGPYVYQYFQGR